MPRENIQPGGSAEWVERMGHSGESMAQEKRTCNPRGPPAGFRRRIGYVLPRMYGRHSEARSERCQRSLKFFRI